MNHTHYALFRANEELAAILPKDFTIATLTKAIEEDDGGTVDDISYNEGMLGRDFHPLWVNTVMDGMLCCNYYLQPTWLYENE